MDSERAFDEFDRAIRTDPIAILVAKRLRDRLVAKLLRRPGVDAVIETGSLARETTVGPIPDADLAAIMDPGQHPGPSGEAGSADACLNALVPVLDSTGQVRNPEPRNHVVRCDMDAPSDYVGFFGGTLRPALPVDVMPAFREGPDLWLLGDTSMKVPERRSDGWVKVNPELLIQLVEERQREWEYFKPVVRMVKVWAEKNNLHLKSAVLEALVLRFMPRPRLFETLSYGRALAGFFENASKAQIDFIAAQLPAGVTLQRELLGFAELRDALREGEILSRQAMDAEEGRISGDPGSYWRKLFGEKFPGGDTFAWVETDPEQPTRAQDLLVELARTLVNGDAMYDSTPAESTVSDGAWPFASGPMNDRPEAALGGLQEVGPVDADLRRCRGPEGPDTSFGPLA